MVWLETTQGVYSQMRARDNMQPVVIIFWSRTEIKNSYYFA